MSIILILEVLLTIQNRWEERGTLRLLLRLCIGRAGKGLLQVDFFQTVQPMHRSKRKCFSFFPALKTWNLFPSYKLTENCVDASGTWVELEWFSSLLITDKIFRPSYMLRNNVVLTSSSLNLEVNAKRMSQFKFDDLEHSFHSNAKYIG